MHVERGDHEERGRRLRSGVLMLLGSGASNQTGAAVGALAFPVLGAVGVVAVRQVVAASVLLPLVRPGVRRWTWAQWWPTLLLGVVFVVMNTALYSAVDRVGLGLAVTLEFLGPLAVSLALSRSPRDLGCALLAALGVWVLVLPGPSSDWLGVGLALVAAACWAGYILLNRTLGRRFTGLEGPAVASGVASVLMFPVLVVLAVSGAVPATAFGLALLAGLLSSVIPYAVDLVALRRVPAGFFGVFMSTSSVFATLAGAIVLGQVPSPNEWVGILLVVAANVGASFPTAGRSRPRAVAGDADAGTTEADRSTEPAPGT